jgi:lysophospholipase L1-like esterase
LVLSLTAGLALAGFLYQQVFVEGQFGPAAMFGAALLATAFLALVGMYALSATRHRELVRNLLLAGTATLVSYVVVDFVAGMVLIQPLSPPLVPDAFRHHVLVPSSYAEFRQRDFAYIQRVNNFGMRGEDVTLEKAPRTRRILMLGDSFTMGKGVEDDETFSAVLGPLIQPNVSACSDFAIEVLNGGVDSYAPILSLIQLRRDLSQLDPDLVVLNLDNSDLVQEAAYRQQAVRAADGEIVGVPQLGRRSAYERARSWVDRRLFFTRVLLVYINRIFDHRELTIRRVVNEMGREHFAHTLEGDVDRTGQWNDLFDSVARIKAHTDSLGIEFVLTTYPWAHQLGDSGWVPGRYEYMERGERTTDLSARTIRAHAAELSVDLFEMFPYFKAYDGNEPLYFSYDPHWTPAGHRIAANALADHLRAHHIPRWCGGG